jgi:K+-sensing histidine kinase KdpD
MDALLELDKLESGHTPLSQAAIHGMNILATTRDLCLPQAHAASVTLKVSPIDCLILADQSKLIRATVNLLEFLIARTPADSQITLSALSTADKSELRLTAPSVFVPETSQAGLFDGFKADHGVQSTPLSDQLSLATARAMIVAHGGQISIHSTVDSGTTFSLLLPPAAPASAEEE